MGIYFAENLQDVEVATVAAFKTSMATKGMLSYPSVTTQELVTALTQETLAADAENRKWLKQVSSFNNGSAGQGFGMLGIPVPANDKPYYLSLRVYLKNSGNITSTTAAYPFLITTRPVPTTDSVPVYLDGLKALHVGVRALTTSATGNGAYSGYDENRLATIELFHAADGTFKVWIDEVPVQAFNMTTLLRPTDGYIYIGSYRTGAAPLLQSTIYYNDVVIVDPATEGLKYRPGKTVRVESIPMTADITKDWSAASGVTNHYPLMNLPFRSVTPAAEMLSSYALNATERYQAAALRSDLGQMVHALSIESLATNTAAAAHSLDFKGAFGTSPEMVVANVTYNSGVGQVFNRVVMNKNPNGNVDWTLAAASAPKMAYTIKS